MSGRRSPGPRRVPPTQIKVIESDVRIINGSYVRNEEHTRHYMGNVNNVDGVQINTRNGTFNDQPGSSLSTHRTGGVALPVPGPNDAVLTQVFQHGSATTTLQAFANPDEILEMGDDTTHIFDAAMDSAFGEDSELQWGGGNDNASTPHAYGAGDASFMSPSVSGVTGVEHALEFAANMDIPPPPLAPIPSSRTRTTTRTTNSTSFTASYQTTPKVRDDDY